MKKLMMLALCASMLVCGGCAQGRIRILNLDFRKPDQISAGVAEAEAPFKDWSAADCQEPAQAPQASTKALPLEWYTALFDMIAKLEARLCLFELEWKCSDVEK